LPKKEGAVLVQRRCHWRQGGVWPEEDVNALHRDGVGAGHVCDEKMAGVEGGVQVLHATVDWAPPQAEVYAPVTAVSEGRSEMTSREVQRRFEGGWGGVGGWVGGGGAAVLRACAT
jgi:hypothetical protein